MSDLVRARIGDVVKNVSPALAEMAGLEVLNEDIRRPDGTLRSEEAAPQTPVDKKSADKKRAEPAKAAEEATE